MGLNEVHSDSADSVTSFLLDTGFQVCVRSIVHTTVARTKSLITFSRCSSTTVLSLQRGQK